MISLLEYYDDLWPKEAPLLLCVDGLDFEALKFVFYFEFDFIKAALLRGMKISLMVKSKCSNNLLKSTKNRSRTFGEFLVWYFHVSEVPTSDDSSDVMCTN